MDTLLVGLSAEGSSQLRRFLAGLAQEIIQSPDLSHAETVVRHAAVRIVICECKLPDGNWRDALDIIAGQSDPPSLIVTSRLADERLWAEVLNLGGYDVLAQPFDHQEVRRVAELAVAASRNTSRFRGAHRRRTSERSGSAESECSRRETPVLQIRVASSGGSV